MPTTDKRLYSLCLPASIFTGRTEHEIMMEVLNVNAIVSPVALFFEYFCEGKKGKAAIENDGQNLTIYFTEDKSVKRLFKNSLCELPEVYFWNIFRIHRPRRYEILDREVWTYVLLAPRETAEQLPEYHLKRCAGGVVGKFSFYDWIFCSAGGDLELLEAYGVNYDGSLSKQSSRRVIPLMNMV